MQSLLMVPGLLCTSEIYTQQVRALWPYCQITIANTLGSGTMEAMARNILAAAPASFALCGISMGSYVCFEIMRQAPERVTRLALLDATARPDTPDQTAQRTKMLAQAESGDFVTWAEAALLTLLHPSHRQDASIAAINRHMAEDIGLEGFRLQTQATIARKDSRPDLGKIKVPTLVLVGEEDKLNPLECSEEIAAGIAGSRLVTVPVCGHATTMEQPEAVSKALIEWLRS